MLSHPNGVSFSLNLVLGENTHFRLSIEELEDYDNMVNEREIEPDYFIDRPPEAVYMPIPRGDDKTT